ncbi:hypothetical protein WR25_26396 [Diploscapter pachys]|uniref:Ferritin/DPS protein domain-containing protein n=1 Tax=Diploscapter pachys TaxID=2018661 RepID=A0A2A2M349_9BILA|nr:hypothetical protein WR25_26396 [Diploscapter pachys]
MLAELREDNLKLVESFRAVKDAAEAAKDNATSGIVDDWTDQAEERAWFLSGGAPKRIGRLLVPSPAVTTVSRCGSRTMPQR